MKLWQKTIKRFLKTNIVIILLMTLMSMFNASVFIKKSSSIYAQATTQKYAEGKGECVMEVDSKRVLYASRSDAVLPMASTTKIVTAITVLELCDDLQEQVVIPEKAVGIEGSSIYLKADEKYTVEELLYGLMLRSGNDAAMALALYCCGSVEDFCKQMNLTAQKAGALTSHFNNPHGLPCIGHYTTAYDLCLITCYAMKNATFRKIVSTKYYEPRHWKNKNKILSLAQGGIGVKTGYTKEAGRCLVSAVERDGMTLVSCVLNCPTTYERSIQLLDDAFSMYKKVTLLQKDEVFTIKNDKKEMKVVVKRDFAYPLLSEEIDLIEKRVKSLPHYFKNTQAQQIVGQIEIYLSKQLLFLGNLYKL